MVCLFQMPFPLFVNVCVCVDVCMCVCMCVWLCLRMVFCVQFPTCWRCVCAAVCRAYLSRNVFSGLFVATCDEVITSLTILCARTQLPLSLLFPDHRFSAATDKNKHDRPCVLR